MFLILLIKRQFMETSVDILAFKAQFVWLVHCNSFRTQYVKQNFDEVK